MKLKNKVLLTLAIFIFGSLTLDALYADLAENFVSSALIIQGVVGYLTVCNAITYIILIFPGRWRKEPNI